MVGYCEGSVLEGRDTEERVEGEWEETELGAAELNGTSECDVLNVGRDEGKVDWRIPVDGGLDGFG